jgi:hypothetical protein
MKDDMRCKNHGPHMNVDVPRGTMSLTMHGNPVTVYSRLLP